MADQKRLPGVTGGPSQKMRQRSGEKAEAVAKAMHDLCERAGVAVVRKVSTHIRPVRRRGSAGLGAVFVGRSTVDCLGVLAGGRAVAVEVKGCADGRLDLDRIEPHQRAELDRFHRLGGLALVLVIWGGEGYAVPWFAIRVEVEQGAKSVGPAFLRQFKCSAHRPYLAQWLPRLVDSAAAEALSRQGREDGSDLRVGPWLLLGRGLLLAGAVRLPLGHLLRLDLRGAVRLRACPAPVGLRGARVRPLRYTRFLELLPDPKTRSGHVELERGQRVLALVAFDGLDPCDLSPEDREIAREIFGPVERVPALARRVLGLVIGGRAGKSYLLTLRLLHLCVTAPLDGYLQPGQRAAAVVVAPDTKTAQEDLGYFVGACASSNVLRGCIPRDIVDRVLENGEMVERFPFRRPTDGRFVEVSIKAVRQGGANVRGRWYVGALLDEACLFYTDGYKLNDAGVYGAITPRLVRGGQMLLSSTPWDDKGVLYRLWHDEFGDPQTAIVGHAPTLTLRPDNPEIREVVQVAFAADEKTGGDDARREFGAEFGTGASDDYLPKDGLKAAKVDAGLAPAGPGELVGLGGDLGFDRNSSALVGAACDGAGVVRLWLAREWRPQGGRSLQPSKVCSEFARVVRQAGAKSLTADRHYQAAMREALEAEKGGEEGEEGEEEGAAEEREEASGLVLEAPPAPEEAWALLKTVVREGRLKIATDTPDGKRLLGQLEAVKFSRAPKGRISILLPKGKDGRHGDLAAAACLAVWAVLRRGHRLPAGPSKGSPEWERIEKLARLERQRKARNDRNELISAGWAPESLGFGDGYERGEGWARP